MLNDEKKQLDGLTSYQGLGFIGKSSVQSWWYAALKADVAVVTVAVYVFVTVGVPYPRNDGSTNLVRLQMEFQLLS